MNLLLLDDDYLELEGLKYLIEKENLKIDQIYTASNVLQAKELVNQEHIEIALCDIEMPVESGIDFARWLAEKKLPIQVIFVTSHAKFLYASQAIRLHARGYLLKPVVADELRENLLSCIQYYEQMNPSEDPQEKEDEVIRIAKEYVREHLSQNISRKDIAGKVFLHPDYLSSIFHEKTGITLSDYIQQERIKESQNLLKNTKESITEISLKCGFSNTAYFSKMFKRITGVTPKQYRGDRDEEI